MRPLDIIVPIYKNASLVEACVRSLLGNLDEIAPRSPRVHLINDSPDDQEVDALLASVARDDQRVVFHTNEINLGFVQTANHGLQVARRSGRDALLVNSDTITFPGTLRELLEVAALDPQTGFVSPRSNNASICSLPHFRGGRLPTPEEAHAHWKLLSRTLPRFHFSPTCVGYYMFVSHTVLANHGGLREEFGVGYEEENDLVMRASKVGARAVIANRAFVYHAGSASFALTTLNLDNHRSANLRKLETDHPEFLPLVRRFENSPHFRAERLLSGLLPEADGRIRLVFDLTGMGQHYNGTNEHTAAVLRPLVERWRSRFRIAGIASAEVFRFHGLDRISGLEREDPAAPGVHAVAIRMAQPFDLHHVNVLEGLAPINLYAMLDTIAEDCGPLAAAGRFQALWEYVAETANGLLFISKFSERAFCLRHPAANAVPRMTQLLSTTPTEYRAVDPSSSGNTHVLVLGNHFAHKGSADAGRILSQAFPTVEFVVVGAETSQQSNLRTLRSGGIETAQMNRLIRDASVVVLPAHVEGFGLGLMHALAARKPVVVRRIAATEEILATLGEVRGVELFDADDDLPSTLRRALACGESSVQNDRTLRWSDWADKLAELCVAALEANDIFTRLQRRLRAGDLLRSEVRAVELEHAAGLVMPAPSGHHETGAVESPLTLEHLMALDGREFVEAAYRCLLRRAADASGLAFYVSEIESGLAKRDVLQALAMSPEGRTAGVQLIGLDELIAPKAKERRSLFARIMRNHQPGTAST
jgi:GT2 family glycosyltransferase